MNQKKKLVEDCVKKLQVAREKKKLNLTVLKEKENQVKSFTHPQKIKIHDAEKCTSCGNQTQDFQFMRLTLYQLS